MKIPIENTMKKCICILANSWKEGGRCIAGMQVIEHEGKWALTEEWIRPISHAHTARLKPTLQANIHFWT